MPSTGGTWVERLVVVYPYGTERNDVSLNLRPRTCGSDLGVGRILGHSINLGLGRGPLLRDVKEGGGIVGPVRGFVPRTGRERSPDRNTGGVIQEGVKGVEGKGR